MFVSQFRHKFHGLSVGFFRFVSFCVPCFSLRVFVFSACFRFLSPFLLRLSIFNTKVTAAKFWWKRYTEENSLKSKPHTGRARILNDEIEQSIIERINENPFLTAISFAREYAVNVSVISAILKRHELKCYTAAHQTRLTDDHRVNRLAFCRTMLDEWDDNKLQNIVFSDEKTFCSDVSWRSKVYRPPNARYDPKFLQMTSRSGRITNNYWGAIGKEGPVTDIVRIEGIFNSARYIRLLNSHVKPMMLSFDQPRVFMQDNSPVHTSQHSMAWFSRQTFELLDWPPLSPDLNPIENVWSFMERDWPQIHPRNADTLNAVVQERWNILRNDQGIFTMLRMTRLISFAKKFPIIVISL